MKADCGLKRIGSGEEIRFLFGNVRDDVVAATGGVQDSRVHSNLGGGKIHLDRQACRSAGLWHFLAARGAKVATMAGR